MVYQIFDQVWNRVGKTTDFGLKWGKGFRKRAAHPLNFSGSTPPGVVTISSSSFDHVLYSKLRKADKTLTTIACSPLVANKWTKSSI